MIDWSAHYATRARRIAASEIRELLKLLDRAELISFAGGIPDPTLFPREEIAAAYARILGDPVRGGPALQYSVSEGYRPLREWLAAYMGERGVDCGPGNILITNGSQQALDFIAKLFVSPGDPILVARPTYLGALQAFNAYEPSYDLLPGPDNNRTAESFGAASGAPPKLAYAMPEFANPTGTTLSLADRLSLLETARALDIAVIEDAAYERLRYDGEPIASLLALDAEASGGIEQSRVIYCGTFSKTIVPGLRIGWIAAPQEVIHRLVLVKQASDLHTGTLPQIVMHEVAPVVLAKQTEKIRAAYSARRDAMLLALAQHMPPGVWWTRPEGGMFVWVTLPGRMDAAALLQRAIEEAKVAFVPGRAFHMDGSGHNTLRLNFSLNGPAAIAEGIGRLAALIARA